MVCGVGSGTVAAGVCLLLGAGAGGCLVERAGEISSSSQSILEGEVPTVGDYPGVGAVIVVPAGQQPFAGCSGTLIANNLVLTAAHCMSPELLREEGFDPKKVKFGFTLEADANSAADAGRYTGSRKVALHPNFDLPTCDFAAVGACDDIGLILLESDVDGPIQGLAPAEMVAGLQADAALEAAGYGFTRSGDDSSAGILHRGDLTLDQLGDFELAAGLDDRQRVCFGDSGGPLYVRTDAELLQVGITSRAHLPDPGSGNADDCLSGDLFTRVDAYRSWIDETAADLGADGFTKEGEEGGGGGCSTSPDAPPVLQIVVVLALVYALDSRRASRQRRRKRA